MKKYTFFSLLTFLVVLFLPTGSYGQTPVPDGQLVNTADLNFGKLPCMDPSSNCVANSTKIIGAYMGDEFGISIDEDYLEAWSVGSPTSAYLYIEVERTGNKYDLLTEFTLRDIHTNNATPTQWFAEGPMETKNYKVDYEFKDYINDGVVNTIYGLEDIVVSWDNVNDNVPTCGVVILEFNIDRWEDLNKGTTLKTLFPKDLKNK